MVKHALSAVIPAKKMHLLS